MSYAKSLPEQLNERLLHGVFTGELLPGQRLREVELAKKFGVSRTPVRETLKSLSEFGVVESMPKHGGIVRNLSRQTLLIQLYQIRSALEGLAAELACDQMTAGDLATLDGLALDSKDPTSPRYFQAFDEFDQRLHGLIAERSGNHVLQHEINKHLNFTRIVNEVLESLLISEGLLGSLGWDIRERNWRQHVNIVAALKSRDPKLCRDAMVEHLQLTCEDKVRYVSQSEALAGNGRAASVNGPDGFNSDGSRRSAKVRGVAGPTVRRPAHSSRTTKR